MNRRNFVVSLCTAISALALPFSKKRPARSNWTRVHIRRDFWTGSVLVTATYRDCSVPIKQRKKYAVGFRVPEERLENLGPAKAKIFLRQLRDTAAKIVERGAKSENPDLLTRELEAIRILCAPEMPT